MSAPSDTISIMTALDSLRNAPDHAVGRSPHLLGQIRSSPGRRTVEENRRANLWAKFGITLEEYDTMRAVQDYRCAVCRRHEDEIPRGVRGRPRLDGEVPALAVALFVDHCHVTERVRRLLCNRCNLNLGYAEDDAALLRACADYAETHAPNDVEPITLLFFGSAAYQARRRAEIRALPAEERRRISTLLPRDRRGTAARPRRRVTQRAISTSTAR